MGNPGIRTAQLQWTPGSDDQTAWDIFYKADGDADSTIVEAITKNPYTLTGLEPETNYIVRVRGNCGGGNVSRWSNEITLTTDILNLCEAVRRDVSQRFGIQLQPEAIFVGE
ncbi:MAG: fibronectin type III domain-containing protein [Bacteroidaceae bacterium]|nr:fibronectin type III domain-containing protein [Bacteroidaceae bacterium]